MLFLVESLFHVSPVMPIRPRRAPTLP
jgi:hypothetical protein